MYPTPTPQLSGPEWLEREHIVLQRLGQLSEVQWLSFYGQPSMFAQLKTELLPPRRASPFPLGKSRTSPVWSPAPHWKTCPFPYPLHTVRADTSVGHTPPLKPSPPPPLPLKARRNNTGPLQLPLKSLQSSLWLSPTTCYNNIQPHFLPSSLSSRFPALFGETS